VQPAKKRKLSWGVKEKDPEKEVSMGDEPGTADTATETNGHSAAEQPSNALFVSNDEHGVAPIKKQGKSLIGDWRI